MRAQRHVVVGACALWILAYCLAGASTSGHRFASRRQSGARRLFVAAPAVRDVNGLGPARSGRRVGFGTRSEVVLDPATSRRTRERGDNVRRSGVGAPIMFGALT